MKIKYLREANHPPYRLAFHFLVPILIFLDPEGPAGNRDVFEPMVFIEDGSSEHVAHVWCKIGILREKKIGFDFSFDVTKCLQQIGMPDLLYMCA